MPFANAAKEEGNIEEPRRKLPKSWGIQVVLSVAGGAFFLWEMHQTDFRAIHPLPAFADRLRQLQVPLLEYLAGIACLIWFGVLMALQKLQKEAAPGAKRSKLSKKVRWIFFVASSLAFAGVLGEQIEKVLWPAHWLKIQLAGSLTVMVTGLAAPFLSQWGQKTRIPRSGNQYAVQPEPRFVSTNVLLALVMAAGVLGTVGLIFAAKRYAPGHGRIAGVVGVIFLGICFLVWEVLQRPIDGTP